jgi:hypothetical protein
MQSVAGNTIRPGTRGLTKAGQTGDAEPAKPTYGTRRRPAAEMVHYGNW